MLYFEKYEVTKNQIQLEADTISFLTGSDF